MVRHGNFLHILDLEREFQIRNLPVVRKTLRMNE